MTTRILGILFAAAALLLAVAGCYGPSPSLDPVINWKITMPDTKTDPTAVALPYMKSGEVVLVDSTDVKVSDSDRVTSVAWTQTPAVGTFTSTDTLTTTWAAPILKVGDPPLPVALSMTVKTELGGKSVNVVHVIVLPPG